MNLRSVTLLAAIGQILGTLFLAATFVSNFAKLRWTDNPIYMLGEPFYIFSHAAVAAFLFTLFAKQKKGS